MTVKQLGSSRPVPDLTHHEIDGRALQGQPERFLNRELSWLAFNRRVLEEAQNVRHPLFERLRFLSIAANNQEEFLMVRVAHLKHKIKCAENNPTPDGLTPDQQVKVISEPIIVFAQDLQKTWIYLKQELQKEGISIVQPSELSEKEHQEVLRIFISEIFPVLTPIIVDAFHPFPFIPNLAMALALRFQDTRSKNLFEALVILPTSLTRFIELPGKKQKYISLEDLVLMNVNQLYPDPMKLLDYAVFRILRDSGQDVNEHAEDSIDVVTNRETAMKRRRGNVINVSLGHGASHQILNFLRKNLSISDDALVYDDMLGKGDLKELINTKNPEFIFTPFEPRYPQRIRDFDGDCFAAIKSKDLVIHHPYESFDVVVHFLRQAAKDPDVISIKQTIYRTSPKSPIIETLIEAAKNGKSVTVVIELKARFDEEANLRWARKMEKAGVQVFFSFNNQKTHAKVALVTRCEGKKITNYAHFGTGNYHPDTAKIYSDLSFFTCDKDLCHDVMLLFNYMTSHVPPTDLARLSIAPIDMRQTLKVLILVEIKNAKRGLPAHVWLKCNSLADPEIIDLLYKASQVGVDIKLIVRGICVLRPGIKGLSEKIQVISIVGRFLEHARIYCFANGHEMPSTISKLFMSSSDLMSHNLDHRIETLVEITNPTVHRQILEQIIVANLADETQSWQMQSDGTYNRIVAKEDAFCAHDYFMKNSSLSGRGKTGRDIPMLSLNLLQHPRKI